MKQLRFLKGTARNPFHADMLSLIQGSNILRPFIYPPRYLPKKRLKLMLTCTLFKIIERFINISIKIELLALRQNKRLFQKLSP